MLEGLKARLERLLREHGRSDPRAYAAELREALLEAKIGVSTVRDALGATERELASERKQMGDAERRGRLAAAVPDSETVALAERFAARHRERVMVLERKLEVQREELALAEREVAEMAGLYRAAVGGSPSKSVDAAWRDLQSAGGARSTADDPDLDRRQRDEAVEAQLAYLKRKLGKQ